MHICVGQVFWFVPKYNRMRGHGYPVTVSKVGRKWIYAGNIRFDKNLVVDDEFRTPGTLYESAEAYEKMLLRDKLWNHFQRIICNSHSPILPARNEKEAILKACEVLGIHVDLNSLMMSWKPSEGQDEK